MKKLIYIGLLSIIIASCSGPFKGYTELDKGLFYKVRYFTEDTLKPEHGDMVKLRISLDLDTSQVISSEQVLLMPYDTTASGLQAHLGAFHIGDSLTFLLSKANLQRDFQISETLLSDYYPFEMKVVGMVKRLDWERDKAIELALKKEMEEIQIKTFIGNSSKSFVPYKGMYVSRQETVDSVKVNPDMSLYVYYISRMLDGRLVDVRVMPDDYISYKLGMSDQLIPGLERMIASMYVNEELELIIPFELAFGAKGVGGDIVPPYTPLHYKLKVCTERNNDVQFDVSGVESFSLEAF